MKRLHDKVLTYMKPIKDIIGKGWGLHAEGQKLQSESTAFRKKRDTRPVYDAWHTISIVGKWVSMGDYSRPSDFEAAGSNWRPLDYHAVQGGPESAVLEFPGPACDYEHGKGRKEGVSMCC